MNTSKNEQNEQKGAEIFYCKICDYKCYKKGNYVRHLLTAKHMKNDNTYKILQNTPQNEQNEQKPVQSDISNDLQHVCECGKSYKHRQSLNNHRQKCTFVSKKCSLSTNDDIQSKLIDTLIKTVQNQQQAIQVMEDQNKIQAKQTESIVAAIKETNNITTNNNTNNHNNTFNINVFLNEKCKDAMNMIDFVNSVKEQLQVADLERVGRVGYVEGMSKILLTNLADLEVEKRPIHCSDTKRLSMYIKNNDEWHKENPENGTVKNVIRSVGHEVLTKQSDWEQANPEHSRTITKKKQFSTMCHNTVDGMLDEKAGTKIIRNLANVVAIDRDSDLKDE